MYINKYKYIYSICKINITLNLHVFKLRSYPILRNKSGPLRDLVLNYVEDATNTIKPNVKLNLIKDITHYKATANLQSLETNHISPLRFIKTTKPLP